MLRQTDPLRTVYAVALSFIGGYMRIAPRNRTIINVRSTFIIATNIKT